MITLNSIKNIEALGPGFSYVCYYYCWGGGLEPLSLDLAVEM